MYLYLPALDNLQLFHQGKTRDTFLLPDHPDLLLVVATDRLSTHNIVHRSRVPRKGEVLTALTVFWADEVLESNAIPHHVVAYGSDIYEYLPGRPINYPTDLRYRALVIRRLRMYPVEFVVRAYLAGSLYKEFVSKGLHNPYGIPIPPKSPLMKPFWQPVCTPTDKSATDDPRDASKTAARYPGAMRLAMSVFTVVRQHLNERGLELVDSKFEIGTGTRHRPVLVDEIATPDSSRFCKRTDIELGKEPQWLDKQIARNEAERLWGSGRRIPLSFSTEVVYALSDTYMDLFRSIAETTLDEFQREWLA